MPDFPATDPLFLSTLSLRRATPRPSPSCHPVWDFYPRSPCGERPGTIGAAAGTAAISIHALLAESDNRACPLWTRPAYFYPRSPCGERRKKYRVYYLTLEISIHALLAESDKAYRAETGMSMISIHALLAESDAPAAALSALLPQFLSTLSLRRATWSTPPCKRFPYNFYPRSPCGERPGNAWFLQLAIKFLSTLSLRRATFRRLCGIIHRCISIHALLAESDRPAKPDRPAPNDFYPRSPCGERRAVSVQVGGNVYFYPRSPCGERPPIIFRHCTTYLFLSTLSLRRATQNWIVTATSPANFYPRSPCGERRRTG